MESIVVRAQALALAIAAACSDGCVETMLGLKPPSSSKVLIVSVARRNASLSTSSANHTSASPRSKCTFASTTSAAASRWSRTALTHDTQPISIFNVTTDLAFARFLSTTWLLLLAVLRSATLSGEEKGEEEEDLFVQ